MDKMQKKTALEAAVEQLNLHGVVTATIPPYAGAGTLYVQGGPTRTEFQVVTRREEAGGLNKILVTQYVKQKQAETFKNQDVNFIDAAGNAYLKGLNFLIWVTGRRPDPNHVVTPEPQGRAFEPKGLQVVFALLCRPDAVQLPYRTLAELANVAHGTVGHVVKDLETLGFVARGPAPGKQKRGARKLVRTHELLDQWAQTFVRTARARYLIGRYRLPPGRTLAELGNTRWADLGAELGGEFAADIVTGNLRPGTLTLYTPRERVGPELLRLGLQPDPKGNIEILQKFWKFDATDAAHPGLVPLPLQYADLIAIGGPRCLETAALLHAKIVAG